jgi:hypothetical protein
VTQFPILRCLLKLGRNLEAVEDAKKAVERARYSIVALDALGTAFFISIYSYEVPKIVRIKTKHKNFKLKNLTISCFQKKLAHFLLVISDLKMSRNFCFLSFFANGS